MDAGLHRKLVEESSDITTIIDPDGKISYVSPSVEHVLGYEPEELIGEIGYEYQHPEDRDAVAEAVERVRTDPEDRQVIETRFRRADGSWCWIEATLQNRQDDPEIEGILVNSREISQRKRRETEYHELAHEYETLLRSVEDAIFYLTVERGDGGYTFTFDRVSKSYEEQTGISTEDVNGKTPTAVFGDELGAELHANYRRCVEAREPITYQEELPVETGARYWQTNLAPVVTNGEVTEIIGITRNVTERVKRERQLRSQNEQLDEFARVVSHDIRNPLNVAQGRAELLAEESTSEHIEPIVRSLDRMEEIVADTFTLARQGQVVAESQPIDLVTLVGECWRAVSTDAATVEIDDDVTVEGDRSRLRHVFENLFRNAIEHGGEAVTVRIGRLGDTGLYVEDTGSGIPEDERDAVFDLGHSAATDGTGFGLTIVKRIVEAHGWQIAVTEGEEGGARFEITGVEFEAP